MFKYKKIYYAHDKFITGMNIHFNFIGYPEIFGGVIKIYTKY